MRLCDRGCEAVHRDDAYIQGQEPPRTRLQHLLPLLSPLLSSPDVAQNPYGQVLYSWVQSPWTHFTSSYLSTLKQTTNSKKSAETIPLPRMSLVWALELVGQQ